MTGLFLSEFMSRRNVRASSTDTWIRRAFGRARRQRNEPVMSFTLLRRYTDRNSNRAARY